MPHFKFGERVGGTPDSAEVAMGPSPRPGHLTWRDDPRLNHGPWVKSLAIL